MTGCTKQTTLTPASDAYGGQVIVTNSSNEKDYSVANPNNPYDSIGYYHNKLLLYFIAKGLNYKTNIAQKVDWASEFSKPIYGKNVANKIDSLKYNKFFMQYEGSVGSVTYTSVYDTIENWEQNGNIGKLIEPYFIEVLNTLDDIDTSKMNGYKITVNEIISIENTISENNKIDSAQKADFFYFSSVARYSTYFWFTHKDLLNNLDRDNLSQLAARASLDAMAGGATLIETAWEDAIPVFGWGASLLESAIVGGIASCG